MKRRSFLQAGAVCTGLACGRAPAQVEDDQAPGYEIGFPSLDRHVSLYPGDLWVHVTQMEPVGHDAPFWQWYWLSESFIHTTLYKLLSQTNIISRYCTNTNLLACIHAEQAGLPIIDRRSFGTEETRLACERALDHYSIAQTHGYLLTYFQEEGTDFIRRTNPEFPEGEVSVAFLGMHCFPIPKWWKASNLGGASQNKALRILRDLAHHRMRAAKEIAERERIAIVLLVPPNYLKLPERYDYEGCGVDFATESFPGTLYGGNEFEATLINPYHRHGSTAPPILLCGSGANVTLHDRGYLT